MPPTVARLLLDADDLRRGAARLREARVLGRRAARARRSVVFIAVPNGPISSALRRKFAGLATAAVGTTAAASDGASEESSERPCSGLSARPLRSSQRPIQPTWPASLSSPTS